MRIKSIELAWFRGAADPVPLETDCKSMVVYGANGSGKSSFVDAVEYVLNKGNIEHLKHEYSSSYQSNAIVNTCKPDNAKSAIKVKFGDNSVLKLDFNPNGSSKTTGTKPAYMDAWEYKQTVLRQNEVSAFITNNKRRKILGLAAIVRLGGKWKMRLRIFARLQGP